jgi:hypothetical protein
MISIILAGTGAGVSRAVGDRPGGLADHHVDPGGGILPESAVLGLLVVAEFEHLAEDGESAAAALDRRQCVQGGAGRVGIGVVGVVEQRRAAGEVAQLRAPLRQRGGGQRRRGHLPGVRRPPAPPPRQPTY